jgi:hypothetical protein
MVIVEKTPYQSIEVRTETDDLLTLSVGDKVEFITENEGELKKGNITNLKGSKAEKVEIEIIPIGRNHKEVWPVVDLVEGSLKLVEEPKSETDSEVDEE